MESVIKEKWEQWRDEYLSSEEGQLTMRKWRQCFLKYLVSNAPTTDKRFLDELKCFVCVQGFSDEEILKVYEKTLLE
jgi:hypothetical protein